MSLNFTASAPQTSAYLPVIETEATRASKEYSPMPDWLAAVGVVANPISNIVDAVTGTGSEKAKAIQAAENAKAAQAAAEIEAARLAAKSNSDMMLYGLIGVGVVVAGAIAYKAVA